MKGMGPIRVGVENCQKAIDYIMANPGATTAQVAEALGWTQDAARSRLRRMADRGELGSKETKHTSIAPDGSKSVQHTHAFTARVEVTRSIEETRVALSKNLPNASKPKKQPDPPWLTRNTRYDDQFARPLPNQGGQGTIGVKPRGYCSILGE